ncbi:MULTISPECIES: hypothetical protein [Pseudacidovorax]|jgi:hypothetical protein|uniref:Uncharacterized protein n=2 Tax=Pseudacidovorax intermedius TaxID=433924 RepID=A0A147GTW8_9BURK|nr:MULTISPECIES: hypothetical protein [Pseudacidovorax]KTT20882.1 hypothetical protein NS331_13095 [Pseudacidovorax intermedius]MBO9643386.1 hypothetical protein [Pseudacidovorax sp.]MBP6894789.1 hypothetical protein [Pseudacidovorax sp.]RDI19503.1 hypothetical protein DFR41_1129 [Pseudacidovorax intermedius]SIQ15739.1 hypothetical protein SAMN05880557_102277 [Pseudacidovorax sp. RU35E]
MASSDVKTTMDEAGLRYKSKTPGSPFKASSSFSGATMSCFLCGKHRPRSLMQTKRVLGKAQPVCAPSCKELEATLKGGG